MKKLKELSPLIISFIVATALFLVLDNQFGLLDDFDQRVKQNIIKNHSD